MGWLDRIISWLESFLRLVDREPPEPEDPTPVEPPGDGPVDYRMQLFSLHNQARARENKSPVVLDSNLNLVAQGHADWMARNRTMDHRQSRLRPPITGVTLSNRLQAGNISYRTAGENIALTNSKSTSGVFQLWLDSPGHRRNIMRGDYQKIGVGAATSSDSKTYWCIVFVGASQTATTEAVFGLPGAVSRT